MAKFLIELTTMTGLNESSSHELCQSLSEEVQALENAIIIRLIDKFVVMHLLPQFQLL